MSPRIKKLVGTVALLSGLVAYVLGAAVIADFVPKHWLVQLLFFAFAGIGWALPAIPLIKWMNADQKGGR
jgi:hypothetical protein